MAKLIFTAAALFLLFAFSHTCTPSDLPNGLVVADEKIPVTDADVKEAANTLRLPSERLGSGTIVDLEPETIVIAPDQPKFPESEFSATILSNEENTIDASKSETVPLTVISFRPVGRHFPRRPFPMSFRHSHRCCHGQGKWTMRFHDAEREKDDTNTPYGTIPSAAECARSRPGEAAFATTYLDSLSNTKTTTTTWSPRGLSAATAVTATMIMSLTWKWWERSNTGSTNMSTGTVCSGASAREEGYNASIHSS